MTTATVRRRVARLEENSRAGPIAEVIDPAALARARLFGAVDSARRSGLREWHLVALGDRLDASASTLADVALFEAFDQRDLSVTGMTGAGLMMTLVKVFSNVGGIVRPASDECVQDDAALMLQAAIQVRRVGAVLIDRMSVVPTAKDLERVDNLIVAGEHSDEDLAYVRAVPAALLRMMSTERHYPVFVDYRLWDY